MKKILKRIGVIILSLFLILLFVMIGSFVNHKIQLSKEEELLMPPGELVDVNGHLMHVYAEGSGEETLVFMAGGGTSSPVLDFKSLYRLLSDTYRVVVVEKAGYGYSEIADVKRDIDTILSETREALAKAGEEGPYTLFPHSMSGIEAIHWAQSYPTEIKAIVGLDMAVPMAYEDLAISTPLIGVSTLAARTGLIRWLPAIAESDAVKYGTLTEEEKDLYKVIFYRRTSTKDMNNEIKNIKTNARKVAKSDMPDVPMLLFTSNGEGTGWDEKEWTGFQHDFISEKDGGKIIELEASHYVHDIAFERIAEEAEKFINRLQ